MSATTGGSADEKCEIRMGSAVAKHRPAADSHYMLTEAADFPEKAGSGPRHVSDRNVAILPKALGKALDTAKSLGL